MDPQPAPPTPGAHGAWYAKVCLSADGSQGFGDAPAWVDDAAAPAVVAQFALAKLRLPAPAIRTNPDASKANVLPYLPVWLWVDGSSWNSRSATASVPGRSVTATATPTKVAWRLGDGTPPITCGRGTAWIPGTDPNLPSPTCGHTFDFPATRTLTATITWTVTWAGGGQAGTVPDLTTTAQTTVHVADAPTVNGATR